MVNSTNNSNNFTISIEEEEGPLLEEFQIAQKKSFCSACHEPLRSYQILICSECLDLESDYFLKMALKLDSFRI